MTLSINPPFPTFQDVDGKPLENGYIWIGTENLDPQTSPIAVYWDEALTQLAAQPIRTNGGYPVNAGTPVRIYVNAAYSIRVMDKKGRVVYSSPSDTLYLDSAHVRFIQDGVGAAPRTSQSKMRERISILDFAGADPTGVTSSSTAFQNALNKLTNNSQLDLCGGSYLLDTAVSRSGLSRIRVIGNGAQIIEASPATAALMSFDNCQRLRVEDVHFVGSETYTYFAANSPTVRRRFLSVANSSRVRIKDVTGQAKRGHIYLNNCNSSIVEGSDFIGFFQNVSLGAQANANECTTIEIDGGRHNKAVRNHAENHGSVVLWGSDAVGTSASDCTGMNLHDNGVYGSSGDRGRIFGCDFEAVIGSAVKTRGSQNIVFGNTGSGNVSGSVFAITGNGATADAYGANGYGNIAIANSAANCVRDGFGFTSQDGLYMRDSVIALNTVNNITGSGGFAGLRGTMRQGGIIFGNVTTQLTCDYGILSGNLTAGQEQKTMMLFGNVVNDLNGAQQGIRVQATSESIIGGNVGDDVVNLVQGRSVTDSVILANVNPNGTSANGFSSANSNSGNVVIGNRGVSSVDGNTHASWANWPTANNPAISSTPNAVNQLAVQSGIGYIATGTASSADWKQITP